MLLSARMLSDVGGVNIFEVADKAQFTQGDETTIYFQLIDASLDTPAKGFSPSGRRFMPAAGATLSVVFDNINDAKKITRAATQPFALDASIWAVQVFSTDAIAPGTVSLTLTLTEGPKVTKGIVLGAVGVTSATGGC